VDIVGDYEEHFVSAKNSLKRFKEVIKSVTQAKVKMRYALSARAVRSPRAVVALLNCGRSANFAWNFAWKKS
jgi:hypothetical protein